MMQFWTAWIQGYAYKPQENPSCVHSNISTFQLKSIFGTNFHKNMHCWA